MVVILLVIAVFSRCRQQKGLLRGFLGWQRCRKSFSSQCPSQRGQPPSRAAIRLRWVHPLSCMSAHSFASRSSSITKGDAAAAKLGPISSVATTFQQKFVFPARLCHRAGSYYGRGGEDAASCLCVGVANVGKAQHLGDFPSLARKVSYIAPFCPQTAQPGLK